MNASIAAYVGIIRDWWRLTIQLNRPGAVTGFASTNASCSLSSSAMAYSSRDVPAIQLETTTTVTTTTTATDTIANNRKPSIVRITRFRRRAPAGEVNAVL